MIQTRLNSRIERRIHRGLHASRRRLVPATSRRDLVCIESDATVLARKNPAQCCSRPDVKDYKLNKVMCEFTVTAALVQATGLFTQKMVRRFESLHRRLCRNDGG